MCRMRLLGLLIIGLSVCRVVVADQGDDCLTPIVVELPAALPYADLNQHTCGRHDFYNDPGTCIDRFSGGEEIIYQLNLVAPIEIQITMDPKGQPYTAVVLDDSCPPAGPECLAHCQNENGQPRVLECLRLVPGTYTLMVDCWPTPDFGGCIVSFDLTIDACQLPLGACCLELDCVGTMDASACAALGGTWYEDFDCDSFACPIQVANLPESCRSAYQVATAPFSAELNTWTAGPDGPAGTCNSPGATRMQNDVWFAYRPSEDCELELKVIYDYNGITVVYSGPDCDQLTELYCLDSGWQDLPDEDSVQFDAAGGTTYWFQVGDSGISPGGGPTLLALSCTATITPGDMNCDGQVNFRDINPFVLALSNPSLWQAQHPGCPLLNGDINGNGTVGFDDINPFVALLSHP